ncbi:MAG: peptide chain release factor N(5)-glutamine methyltransferase [Patescibacteria group bacterium]
MTYSDILKNTDLDYLDTDVILSFVTEKNREYIFAHQDKELLDRELREFNKLVKRRQKGEPIAYITGHKEFYGLDFMVNKDVLVPRPDTELIVENVINVGNVRNEQFEQAKRSNNFNILDVGTGSGCIPVVLKKQLPKANVYGSDISGKAIKIARMNAKRLLDREGANIKFYKSDLLKQIPKNLKGKLDIITFNPPYLTKNEARKKELKFEPQVALTPKDFQKLINEFLMQTKFFLKKDGMIFMEIGHRQAGTVKKIISKIFPESKIEVVKDLGGFDRVVKIKI